MFFFSFDNSSLTTSWLRRLSSTIPALSLALCHYIYAIRHGRCVGVIQFMFVLFQKGTRLIWNFAIEYHSFFLKYVTYVFSLLVLKTGEMSRDIYILAQKTNASPGRFSSQCLCFDCSLEMFESSRVKLCVCMFKALGLSTISLLQNKKNTAHDSCLSPLFSLTNASNHHLV